MSILNILGNKESDDRLIRELQLLECARSPSSSCVPCNRTSSVLYFKKELKKVRKLAIDVFNDYKHRVPKQTEVSGIFNVGMIVASAMIQDE
jgi:hypothetical protein